MTTKNTNTTEPNGNGIGGQAKSCQGCLYYSSRFKDESRNPLCVGLTRSFPFDCFLRNDRSEADVKAIMEFRYACVGFSLYNNRKSQTSGGQETQTELPFCLGLEVMKCGIQRVKSSEPVSHIHNKGDGSGLPQKGPPKPAYPIEDEFFIRFTRSASVVANGMANGIAKKIRRVGNQIKQSLDDIMYRRPK